MDMTKLLETADTWEKDALKQEFAEAVEYVGTSTTLELSESVQRQLFGLYSCATRGPPPKDPPAGTHEEHWKAWLEFGHVSQWEAMRKYIDVVSEHDPDFLLQGLDSKDEPATNVSAAIELKKRLADAGFHQQGSSDLSQRVAESAFEAARVGDVQSLETFLPAAAGDGFVNEDGLTPLIVAIDAEREDAVASLLRARASANVADPQSSTPLHYAAMLGASSIAELLLEAGAVASCKDDDGLTPAESARGEGHAELADRLEAAVRV